MYAAAQLAAPLVEQIDGERFELDQPRDESRDLLEEIVEIEDAGDLPAQVEERRDELALAPRFPVPPVAGALSAGCPGLTEACLSLRSRRRRP